MKCTSEENGYYSELEYDSTLVDHLAGVLTKSPTARSDLWDWAEQIVNAVEFEAYGSLDAMLFPEERATYAQVSLAYLDLRRLVSRIRESVVAHRFMIGYSANEAEANSMLGEVKSRVEIVRSETASALRSLQSL